MPKHNYQLLTLFFVSLLFVSLSLPVKYGYNFIMCDVRKQACPTRVLVKPYLYSYSGSLVYSENYIIH